MKRISSEIFLMFLVSLLSTLVPAVNADPLAENQARIGVITGDVGFLSQGAPDWIEPHEGLPLEPGDHIRTGEDGHVELQMSENALWILEPDSEVETEHIEANAGRLNLLSGALLGRVDSARAAGVMQRWEFNTPVSVAAVRGTEFALQFSKTEGSRLGVFEGTIELQPAETAQGLQPPTRVAAGQEAMTPPRKPTKLLGKFSPLMQTLAAKRAMMERRHTQIQNTWTPFTTAVRTEARKRFAAAPPKRARVRPHPARPRHSGVFAPHQ
jgi:hypothetical protein